MKYFVMALLLCWGAMFAGFAAMPPAADLTPAQAQRYHKLTEQLRCPICQNETIAESDADISANLRQLVARHIVDGASNAQIKAFLVQRYGDWILYDPPFQRSTWLLWLSPFVLLAIALAAAILIMRRVRRGRETAPRLDGDRLARLLEEEGGDDERPSQ
jgi:cytochrome c-type biogenesis protein CcmH